MSPIGLLGQCRGLAERIPYSVVALVSRIAVASVFWQSGQTKVAGFSIREETFALFSNIYNSATVAGRRRIFVNDWRTCLLSVACGRSRIEAFRGRIAVYDRGDRICSFSPMDGRNTSSGRACFSKSLAGDRVPSRSTIWCGEMISLLLPSRANRRERASDFALI